MPKPNSVTSLAKKLKRKVELELEELELRKKKREKWEEIKGRLAAKDEEWTEEDQKDYEGCVSRGCFWYMMIAFLFATIMWGCEQCL